MIYNRFKTTERVMYDESPGIQQEGRKLEISKEDGGSQAECRESKSSKVGKKKHKPIEPGDRFGRLTVISFSHSRKRPSGTPVKYWNCSCLCGTHLRVMDHSLKAGTSSCGCLRTEILKGKVKHGLSRSPEYRAWADMKDRCGNPFTKCYNNYGGRGIKVCDRWIKSFENFFEDMGKRPSKLHSLDRIDVNGNYESGNCRWATMDQQLNNKRTSVYLFFRGEKYTLSQLAKKYGFFANTIRRRLFKLKWTIEKAVSEPSKKSKLKCFSSQVLNEVR